MKDNTLDKTEKISYIVSVYNIEDTVKSLYASSRKMLARIANAYEMIFVDDGSSDGTYTLLQTIAKNDKQVKIIRMRSPFGEASALEAGLKYSEGKRIIFYGGRIKVPLENIEFSLLSLLFSNLFLIR